MERLYRLDLLIDFWLDVDIDEKKLVVQLLSIHISFLGNVIKKVHKSYRQVSFDG